MTLEQIATKYGTLKVQHGYMPIYERFFEPLREENLGILEIGVHEGASIKTWVDYFPYSLVVGADKNLVAEVLDADLIECDPSKDISLLERYSFDIIIDDGSHIGLEQIGAFANLWPKLSNGGWYVVEDLFTAYDPVWNPEGPKFIDHIQSRLKNILIGGDSIQEVHWFGRNDINGILFLRKRYQDFRIQPLSEFQ